LIVVLQYWQELTVTLANSLINKPKGFFMTFTQEQINRTNDLRTAKAELQRHTFRLSQIINSQRSLESGAKRPTRQEVEQAKAEKERLLAALASDDTKNIYAEIERHKKAMPEKNSVKPKSQGQIDSLLIDKLNQARR
jgi:hypothetical protein